MTLHPIVLTVILLDVLTLGLVLAAVPAAMRILLHWSPCSSTRTQLRLETEAETAAIRTAWALGIFTGAGLLLIVGITNIFPTLVPGAMCGSGVLQATHDQGQRALILRALAGAALYMLWTLNRLDNRHPQALLTLLSARVLLMATPLVVVAVGEHLRTFPHLEVRQAVNCCAVVYDQFRSSTQARSTGGLSDAFWLWATALGGSGLLAHALACMRRPPEAIGAAVLALLALAWPPLAGICLVKVLSAYHYHVLAHHCPWCLFLPEFQCLGFALWGALIVVGLEGSVAYAAVKVARSFPLLAVAAHRRTRMAGTNVAIATLLFFLLAGLPALWWRMSFGVWL